MEKLLIAYWFLCLRYTRYFPKEFLLNLILLYGNLELLVDEESELTQPLQLNQSIQRTKCGSNAALDASVVPIALETSFCVKEYLLHLASLWMWLNELFFGGSYVRRVYRVSRLLTSFVPFNGTSELFHYVKKAKSVFHDIRRGTRWWRNQLINRVRTKSFLM